MSSDGPARKYFPSSLGPLGREEVLERMQKRKRL